MCVNWVVQPTSLCAQYPPAAGKPGTTAMRWDSAAFIDWASTCVIERGYVNLADTSVLFNDSNRASYGSYLYGSGPPDELVVSLGDHGSASLGFNSPIVDRPGPDFAVFENSFGDTFLELGFVEVSSDGKHFVRFRSFSLTPEDEQINTFDTIDATKIHNFAGKYRHGYGTPFDLDDLKDSSGIDLSNITAIRLIDVGGCMQPPFATYDSKGHKVNDPWPTPFDTGGFDLDAVGVIHNQSNGFPAESILPAIHFYPNPVVNLMFIASVVPARVGVKISDIAGRTLVERQFANKVTLDLSSLPAGIYIAWFSLQDGSSVSRKIVKN